VARSRGNKRTGRGDKRTGIVALGGLLRARSGLFGVVLALCVPLLFASSALAGFGFAAGGFKVAARNQDGSPDTQAGSHPFEYSTTTDLNTAEERDPEGKLHVFSAGGNTRDIEVEEPPGLVGDPSAVPFCSEEVFTGASSAFTIGESLCPNDTQVGVAELDLGGSIERIAVYNVTPPKGDPAEFGFTYLTTSVVLIPSVRTGGDYGVTVRFTGVPDADSLIRGKITLWGVPADPAHNTERGECLNFGGECSTSVTPKPFLSMPTSCMGPLAVRARIDSWTEPGVYHAAETTIPGMTGCNKLDFSPDVIVSPEPAQAASPSGLSVEIQVPQFYGDREALAESNLKDTTVTLPAGVAVNPSAADGLAACSPEEIGLHDAEEASCPDASKLGSVEITTPLLLEPLRGAIYLAQQGNLPGNGSNPFGSLLALYLVVKDPQAGVLVKLAGEIKPDPVTGQLTTTFLNNPQVPFENLKLSFYGGPRAGLVNPPLCGVYTTSTEMTPWAGGAAASPSSAFAITSGPAGSPCVTSLPFAPSLVAGTTSDQAGGFTPFSLTFDRGDGEQNLSRIQVKTPVGLLGDLSTVALCGEPRAAQGTCGPESEIGHVTVGVGAGSNPFYETGKVFLTGPYEGAPFGLSFVVPAVAGPLNLGVVVVRASVEVDPQTAALTVTSEPLPQILEGVPLHIRAVNVTMDREHFIFNPTDCEPLSIQTAMTSSLGASAAASAHFQVTNCGALAFKPRFVVATSGHASRANGASLDVKLSFPAGPVGSEASIRTVKVELPKRLPSRLSTLQKACTAQTFEANPAACPAPSRVGFAKASTPILPVPLAGPVYFVSHGGEAFPSLIVVLQGYGVRIDLVGSTFINEAGITSSTFKTIPDVPVGTFELYLPQGPYSALAANGNLCTGSLRIPTVFTAQDGAVIDQSTPIGVTGCAHSARRASIARHGPHHKRGSDRARPVSSGKGRSK
jgi:hypothetical protein